MKEWPEIKKVVYEHWKMVFPYLIPFIGALLLSFWGNFRNLMLARVPFWVLFIFLIVSGILTTIILVQLKKIKELTKKLLPIVYDTELVKNLLYKKGDYTQAYCPTCFETKGELKRIGRRNFQGGYDDFCFVCNYTNRIVTHNPAL